MCDIIHSINRTPECHNRCRTVVDTQILCNLVKCPLYKSTVHAVNRLSSICRNTGCQSNRCLFCNSHINKLASGFFSLIFCKSHNCRRSGCDGNHTGIFFHLFQKIISRNTGVVLRIWSIKRFSRLKIKRTAEMPLFFILLCRLITFSFQRIDMNHNRLTAVFYFLKCLHQRFCIVSLVYINIIKPHRFEQVTWSCSVCFPQQLQILIQSSMILCDGHIIVIHYNN